MAEENKFASDYEPGLSSNSTSGYGMRPIEQTGDDTYVAPKRSIPNANVARSMYEVLRAKHLLRIKLYQEIEGLIAGNPPYDQTALDSAGLQHIANFNDMSADAQISRAVLAYHNLLYNAQTLVHFILNIPGVPEVPFYAQKLADNWQFVVFKYWPSFKINLATLMTQLVKLGVSPAVFPDERSPRWRVVDLSRFFIPDQQLSDLDFLTLTMVDTDYTIQDLWEIYESEKDKADSPWNTVELARFLNFITASPVRDQNQVVDYSVFDLQTRLTNGDITYDELYNSTVRLISVFQKEYDGKITHYMFSRYVNDSSEFMFVQDNQYDSLDEALVIFTMQAGSRTVHGNRGLGHKIYSLAQAKIMMNCSVVDMAKWSSTPILKSPSLVSKDVDEVRFYPGVPTNIGALEFVQNNLGANVGHVVEGARYISSLLQFNETYSGADPGNPDPDQGSLSPTQVKVLASREFNVLKNNIQHFYTTMDKLLQNMTAKMFKSAPGDDLYEMSKEWKERCIRDGVPEEVFKMNSSDAKSWRLPKHIEVYATRAAGAGSQVAHLMGLQELQAIAPSFGPREEREFRRQFITATIGAEYVSAFLQEADDVDERAGGASLAGVENAIMQAGKSPIFSKDNEHRAHFTVHAALATETIDLIQQQQMDIIQADSIFHVLVPHLEEHLQALAANPFAQTFYQSAKEAFNQIQRYAQLNRKNAAAQLKKRIKDQQEQAQQQQEVMTDEQLKTMQVMNEEKRKDIKLQAQNERQEKAGQAKEQALKEKTINDAANQRYKVSLDAQTERLKAQLENTAVADAEANPRQALSSMSSSTPAPYDIE